jgi:hypothetical protein
MRKTFAVLVASVGILMGAAPMWAHHAFASEFDEKHPIKLRGVVTQWELVNPHSWIHIDVKNPDGSVTPWMIEGGSPNALFRLGFTKNSLPAGTELIIEGYQAKDGANRGVGAKLTYMDGKSLFLKPAGEDK